MKKAYLFVYSNSVATRIEMSNFFNESKGLLNHWRYDIPNSYYLISENSAAYITSMIRQKFPKGRFIITEISETNRNGWLPKESWELIKNKERKK